MKVIYKCEGCGGTWEDELDICECFVCGADICTKCGNFVEVDNFERSQAETAFLKEVLADSSYCTPCATLLLGFLNEANVKAQNHIKTEYEKWVKERQGIT